jgi:hypothetical protein
MRVGFGDVPLHTCVEALHEILTEPCCSAAVAKYTDGAASDSFAAGTLLVTNLR